ncbi:hypothetical protein [Streptomyces chattanoogensis]|uniref:hypothetical protein n=1 Tax=Streptomyces chattanoogensis TaxID=66876 RepID=UPI000A8052B1|nr:hypothetical protein [Streptomyces chattanoogensis]
MSYTEHQHVKDWLIRHEHEILDVTYSKVLDEYLNSLPWNPGGVQWEDISHVSIEISEDPDVNFLGRCRDTAAGAHEFTMIMYNGSENSILCRSEEAFLNIDLLYFRAPGPRYFCGVDKIDGTIVLHPQDFAEYDISGLTFRVHDK